MSKAPEEVENLSNEHLQWLVTSRSRNQSEGLKIHLLFEEYEASILGDQKYKIVINDLIAINFSLWRAVFLSDTDEDSDYVLRDARKFLKNLIANNVVAYPQDRGAREWTFLYYLHNAQFRLENLHKCFPALLPKDQFPDSPQADDKLWWNECQASSEAALANLTNMLSGKI